METQKEITEKIIDNIPYIKHKVIIHFSKNNTSKNKKYKILNNPIRFYTLFIFYYAISLLISGSSYKTKGSISIHFEASRLPIKSHAKVSFNTVHVFLNTFISCKG